jgi:predicted TPR repeat methyltransferase
MADELEYRGPSLILEALSTTLPGRQQLKVLDLGCGTGLSGQAVRGLARWLVGVDLSPAMIDRAHKRAVYDVLHVAEITAFLGRDDDAFDLVMACDTFIYFGDLRQVIVPAARRLVPNGCLVFTIERGGSHPFRLADSGRFAHHPDHVREVTAEAGLAVASLGERVLRYEYGEPVDGLVAVLARPA